MVSRITKTLLILEALTVRRAKPGEVPFKQTTVQSPHIQEIVKSIAEKTNVPPGAILQKMMEGKSVKYLLEVRKKSPMLYEVMAQNAAETAAFDLAETYADLPKYANRRVVFDPRVMYKLIKLVENEHAQFFPLRGPYESVYIHKVSPIFVPTTNPDLKHYNICTTAMATSEGHFIFNTEFMQKLLDFAMVENLKGSSKKYVSNGGTIPDAYAYIEMLIIHELLHYSYGDMYRMKTMPHYNHQVHNIATDLRSNYMLVKSGYPQLPMGYFSDDINYDRQGSYEEMCRIVKQELDKLSDPLKKWVEENLHTDDHEEGEEGDQPGGDQPGGDQPGGDQPGGDQPGGKGEGPGGTEGPGDKPDGDGDGPGGTEGPGGKPGKPGKGGKPGKPDKGVKGPGPGDYDQTIDDELHKKIEQRIHDAKKDADTGTKTPAPGQDKVGQSSSGTPGRGSGKDARTTSSEPTPEMNWQRLLSKMISDSATVVDPSYAKPHRRSVTGTSIAAQIGAAAVKPGDKVTDEPRLKVFLLFDESGSMINVIPKAIAEAKSLLTRLNKQDAVIGMGFFADKVRFYKVDLKADTWEKMNTVAEYNTPIGKDAKKGVHQLMSYGLTGGTTFGPAVAQGLDTLMKDGFNVLVFSDYDVLVGTNWTHFYDTYLKHRSKFGYVAANKQIWKDACNLAKQEPPLWTYMT